MELQKCVSDSSVASTKMNARHTPRTLPIIQEVAHIIVLLWQGQEQQSECLHCWPCQELRSNQDLEFNLFELTMSNFPLTLTRWQTNGLPRFKLSTICLPRSSRIPRARSDMTSTFLFFLQRLEPSQKSQLRSTELL